MNARKVLARSGTPHINNTYPFAALALSILIAMAIAACNSEAAPADAMPPAPEVSVATVLSKQVRQWDEFTGRVAAVETVELRPRVSGYVERVAFQEGQEVRKGDLLFAIDQRPYRATLESALAGLERARSEARLAQTQDVRAQALVEAKAISREEFETRKAATAQGNAGVRAAEAAVAAARLDLQFTQVRSPIDGRAGRALMTEGNLAQADATLLTTVVSLDPVHVYFESDEQSFLRYSDLARKGERTRSSNPVRVGLANEAGYPHAGVVDFIDNQVDARSGTVRVRAVFDNADGRLMPGQFARLLMGQPKAEPVLLISERAVGTDQNKKFVMVVDKDSKAQYREVALGVSIEGMRVVTGGLHAGERIVVKGLQRVRPGALVAPEVVAMGFASSATEVAQR